MAPSSSDSRSPEEAGAYLRTLKQLLEYIGVSDVSMEEGSLRVDANVSVRLRGETDVRTQVVGQMLAFALFLPAAWICWRGLGIGRGDSARRVLGKPGHKYLAIVDAQ